MTKQKYINANGIVVDKTRWKEKSSFLTCYCEKQGLLSILANPAKKSFLSLANIPVKIRLSYYQSRRDNNYLREMEVIDNYKKIHENYKTLKYSWHIISPIRELISPGGDDMFIFNLVDRALKALADVRNQDNQLMILSSYYLILIKHWGFGFKVNQCVKCKRGEVFRISPSFGGMVCKNCNDFCGDTEMIDIGLLTKIDQANSNSLFNIQASRVSKISIIHCLQKYLYHHFGKTPPDLEL